MFIYISQITNLIEKKLLANLLIESLIRIFNSSTDLGLGDQLTNCLQTFF